jgi:3-hydroxyisobutyrate dehydrogenase-like beta-hydroxyacid dehydrogenase
MSAGPAHIGFVGVGQMGLPMVERLLAASFPVRFFARRPDVVRQVSGLGAIAAGSLAGAALGCDVVIVCVFTDAQVRQVALGDEGLLAAMAPGHTLVVHTTGSPRTVEALALAGERRGVGVIDAAVSGSPGDVRAGRLTLLVGGDREPLEACRPALASYADPIIHLGDLGNGMRVKLVNNAMLAANVQLAVEAARVARRLGIPEAAAIEAITHCSGNTRVLGMAVTAGTPDALRSGMLRFIDKDVAVVDAVAAELGADLGLLGVVARAAVAPR